MRRTDRSAWLLPLGALLTVFYLYPLVDVVRLSFTDATLLDPEYHYTLASYQSVLNDPAFPRILGATLVFVAGSVIGQTTLGLLIALVSEAGLRRELAGARIVQVVVLAAWVIPGVASGVIWRFMLNEAHYGLFNAVLVSLHLPAVAWLTRPDIAIWSATAANIWRGTAFSMVLLHAGLRAIPGSLYEAAALDGATALQSFRFVTLAQLKPILLVNFILTSVLTLNSFDLLLPLTGGGPGRSTEVLSLAAYTVVFHDFDLAQGSVLALLMLLTGFTLTTLCARFLPP